MEGRKNERQNSRKQASKWSTFDVLFSESESRGKESGEVSSLDLDSGERTKGGDLGWATVGVLGLEDEGHAL